MELTLVDILPPVMRRPDNDPDNVIQPILDAFTGFEVEVLNPAIRDMSKITSIDDTPEIELVLKNLGNPMPFVDMTESQKRRLARSLIPMYRKKGTANGIELAILFFTQLTANVVDFASGGADEWVLGESELGLETFLSPGLTSQNLFFFLVEFDECLTIIQAEQVEQIIEFMKPGWVSHTIRDCLNPTTATLPIIEGFESATWTVIK